uniref:Gcp-like domain-containing protein n=1 Tax=Euplotes harpa TaxID=151035 RepID=A0A7S3J002_9SPIT|mmetsp:Transcript_12212/g.13936  ORF Transcript_12212/g.13936 Transcript_12212/m.13936 type:complete len:173 (+) Transcript_12212:501-1019(+)|eukprot:CAMPEP_0168348698 /NCGR_PEP_ID=MMETSP0213-20121227/19923_1 /TAXON_ID=151035 /ORGANISM="Euplotes harpa, Strain FSP1.4" /LENGTH=172 /DNA_ID=CAMNT_0008358393 /DNA_START=583 /DNA_END=1101 /DNA_ORIENTATION=+
MSKDLSLDMSFAGLLNATKNSCKVNYSSKQPEYEEEPVNEFVVDSIASCQLACFKQIELKTRRCLDVLKAHDMLPKVINLAGGCAANSLLLRLIQECGRDYGLDTIAPQREYVQDNPVSVAYMGWKLVNKGEFKDIRQGHSHVMGSIPLGRYVDVSTTAYQGIMGQQKTLRS